MLTFFFLKNVTILGWKRVCGQATTPSRKGPWISWCVGVITGLLQGSIPFSPEIPKNSGSSRNQPFPGHLKRTFSLKKKMLFPSNS